MLEPNQTDRALCWLTLALSCAVLVAMFNAWRLAP